MSQKASRGYPGAARGHLWGPGGCPGTPLGHKVKTEWKQGDNPPPPGHQQITHFAEEPEQDEF